MSSYFYDDEWFWDDMRPANQRECPGGCGQLADECECPNSNPLGAFAIRRPIGSEPVKGSAAESPGAPKP
jgi:hypothetical protein